MATAPNSKPLPKSASFVTVASHLPMTIEIFLCEERQSIETGQFGSVASKINHPMEQRYFIRGTGRPAGTVPKGYPKEPHMLEFDSGNKVAFTPNIPAEFWAKWLEANKGTELVRNRCIYADHSLERAEGMAEDAKEVRSGLDPLNPDKDPRAPRPINPNVLGIETADRTEAA